jgi:hypothetical protein
MINIHDFLKYLDPNYNSPNKLLEDHLKIMTKEEKKSLLQIENGAISLLK